MTLLDLRKVGKHFGAIHALTDVDLTIGVRGDGSCIPGPCIPFGSIHPSPDTLIPGNGGFLKNDPAKPNGGITGFSQLHVQGSGGVSVFGASVAAGLGSGAGAGVDSIFGAGAGDRFWIFDSPSFSSARTERSAWLCRTSGSSASTVACSVRAFGSTGAVARDRRLDIFIIEYALDILNLNVHSR